jgi:hypothetical protein
MRDDEKLGDSAGTEEPVPLEAKEPDSTVEILTFVTADEPVADIQVVEDLHIPTTPEGRQARLAEIKIEITTVFTPFKAHREEYHRGVIKLGALLIEAKEIAGHGGFGAWVNDNCPFKHPTANNYMAAARHVAGATNDTKFLRLMNLSEQGMEAAIDEYLRKRAAAAMRKIENAGQAEERAERAARQPTTLTSAYQRGATRRNRRRGERPETLAAQRAARQEARREAEERRREQAELQELRNLNDVRPHEDSAGLVIESRHEDDVRKVMFVWLPEYAHAKASEETMQRTGGHWQGQAALRYKYIIVEHVYEGEAPDWRPLRKVGAYEDRWEDVADAALHWTRGALRIDRLVTMDRDPLRSEILDNWHSMIDERLHALLGPIGGGK